MRCCSRTTPGPPGPSCTTCWAWTRWTPPAELAVHPADGNGRAAGEHQLYLMCRDIRRTAAELEARGVELTAPISEQRFGLVTSIRVPGGGELGLYQPAHPSPLEGFG